MRLNAPFLDLRGFADDVLDHFGMQDASELDYDDFLMLAAQRGLIRWEPYDPTVLHVGLEIEDVEAGDLIWVPVR